jgi:hypothetical protein
VKVIPGVALWVLWTAAAAGGPPPPGPGRLDFPRKITWGFETISSSGSEISPLEEVPIFIGDRATQPDWVQEFGIQADPDRRDRFPREPLATFSSAESRDGRRSLHLLSRGDCVLIRQTHPAPVIGGLSLRLAAQVKLRGLRAAALFLRIRFSGDEIDPADDLLSSPPIRGDGDWREIDLEGRVPDRADSLAVEICLEGSYRDGEVHAWVDAMSLDLAPGLLIDWSGRECLLWGSSDAEIPIGLRAVGLPPGEYEIEIAAEPRRKGGEGGRLVFKTRRYLPASPRWTSPSGPDLPHPAPAQRTEGLRYRGDLRQMFPDLPGGPLRLSIRLKPSGAEAGLGGGAGGRTGASSSERIGILPGDATPLPPGRSRIGFVVASRDPAGDVAVIAALPRGFPVGGLVWDVDRGGPAVEALPPPEVLRPGERASVPWKGRFGRSFLDDPGTAARLLSGWSLRIRSWEAAVGPDDGKATDVLAKIRSGQEFVSLGAPAGPRRPDWASFRVFEIPPGWKGTAGPFPAHAPGTVPRACTTPGVGAEAGLPAAPEEGDWTIAEAPRAEDEVEEMAALSRLILQLSAAGHRSIHLRGALDVLVPRTAGGQRSPRLAAFAWSRLGRLLAAGPIREMSGLDPRGLFLVVPDAGGNSLVAISRDGATFGMNLWTGGPVRGEDILGLTVEAPHDSKTGESRIEVRPEPLVIRGFDPGLADTVRSLSLEGAGAEETGRNPVLRFRIRNRSPRPLALGMALDLPAGWRSAGGGKRSIPPGEESVFAFDLEKPEGPGSGKVKAGVRMEIERDGRVLPFVSERFLEPASEGIRLTGEALDIAGRTLGFEVENLEARPVAVRAFCRVVLGGKDDLIESWEENLPPAGKRRLRMDLAVPSDALEEKEVVIGASVGGRGDGITGRYLIRKVSGALALVES